MEEGGFLCPGMGSSRPGLISVAPWRIPLHFGWLGGILLLLLPEKGVFSLYESEKDIFRLEKDGFLSFEDFSLIQVSDIQTAPESVCPTHVQFCAEISYLAGGFARHTVNGQTVELIPGDLLLLCKEDVHAYANGRAEPARIFNIGLNFSGHAPAWMQELQLEWKSFPKPLVLRDVRCVEAPFIHIFDEVAGMPMGWDAAVHLHIEHILLLLYRMLKKESGSLWKPESGEEVGKRLLHAVIRYVDGHIADPNVLHDLPKIFHYTSTYLSHFFGSKWGFLCWSTTAAVILPMPPHCCRKGIVLLQKPHCEWVTKVFMPSARLSVSFTAWPRLITAGFPATILLQSSRIWLWCKSDKPHNMRG